MSFLSDGDEQRVLGHVTKIAGNTYGVVPPSTFWKTMCKAMNLPIEDVLKCKVVIKQKGKTIEIRIEAPQIG